MVFVEDFYNQKIYKVKHVHSSEVDDYDMYIFVGNHHPASIYKILTKIENNGYDSLSIEEAKELGSRISKFKTKFGDINKDRTHFIRDFIYDDDSINILRMKISYHLNKINQTQIGIHSQHLWVETRNISFVYFVQFINHLLGRDSEIKVDDLILKLQVLLDVSSQEQLETLIKDKFQDKYRNPEKLVNLFNKEFYTADSLVNDEEFKSLISNRLVVLGREYKKNLRITSNNYIDYPLYVVANPFSKIVDYSDQVVMDLESNQYSKIISDYDSINNNIIYLVTYVDFITNSDVFNKADIASLYWDDLAQDYSAAQLKNEVEAIEETIKKIIEADTKLLNLDEKIQNSKGKKSVMWKGDYQLSHLLISINDHKYPGQINLAKLFNMFETDHNVPFVKYVTTDTNSQYKIFKPFLKRHSFKLKIIASWKHNQSYPDVEYPYTKKCIIFKILLATEQKKLLENYVTLSIYENGFILIDFNFKDTMTVKSAKENIELVSTFINRVHKFIDNNIIAQPETSLIFQTGSSSNIMRTKIENINLDNTVEVSSDITLEELNNRVQDFFPYFYGYLRNNVLKIIYKKVSNFDSNLSINNFINKLFDKNKRAFEGQKSKYLDILEKIFSIHRIKSKDVLDHFNPQDVPENIKYHFLHGVDITVTQENKKFLIQIDNLHHIEQIKFIHYLFNLLFSPEYDNNNKKNQSGSLIELDIEESIPGVSFDDDDVDLGFDFDELGIDELGLDVDLESDFRKDEKAKKEAEEAPREELVIDSEIKKKGTDMHHIKFTNYMTLMRERADPGLYKVEDVGNLDEKGNQGDGWKYSRKCDTTQMRQPYIIPKENLDKIKDPKALTGYIKYRDNYYVCPRIWDYKASMPISVDEFIANDLKSPYTKGEAIPYDRRNKDFLGDKYTVIVRKPTREAYWQKETVEKDWPEALKGTGADAYPGFIKPKGHPKNLCVPCCFLKEPEDYDTNAKNIQAFTKPVGHEACEVQSESEKPVSSHDTEEFNDGVTCRNENYIKTDTAVLDNCRYGQLPEGLNNLLRNHQEILISSHNNALHKYANCFLRRGVYSDKNSFLRCIASVKETISTEGVTYKTLINLIVDNLTPEIFITLNQGSLVNLFKFTNNLPKNRSQLHHLMDFIKKYPDFMAWMGLKNLKINSSDDIVELKNNRLKLRKFKKLFNVFGAFYNFLRYCEDDKVIKRHDFFLDLISRKLSWLFPDGANVIIFAKETNNIFCNPYVNDSDKPLIMLLYDTNGKFEPIFHAQSKGNIIPKGLIDVDHEINMSSKNLLFLKNHLKNQLVNSNLLKDTQRRLPVLKEIIKIHIDNCSELPNSQYGNYKLIPTAYTVYQILLDMADKGYPYLKPVAQITTSYCSATYLITSRGIVFPVRPSGVITELKNYDNIEYFDLFGQKQETTSSKSKSRSSSGDEEMTVTQLNVLLKSFQMFDKKTRGKYAYMVSSIITTDKSPEIGIGLLLSNGGLIPIPPTHVDKILEVGEKLSIKLDIEIKEVYYEADYKIADYAQTDDQRIVKLEEYKRFEHLYQHFKYEFTKFINNNMNHSYRNQIQKMINVDIKDYGLIIKKLKPLISKILRTSMKVAHEPVVEKTKINKKYTLTRCEKLTQRKCLTHPFCAVSNDKTCQLNLESVFWIDLFSNRLCEELMRNSEFSKSIINGDYRPSFSQDDGLHVSPDEILLTNETFYLIKQIYKSSKYHQEIDIFDTVEIEHSNERVIKIPYQKIDEKSGDIGKLTQSSSIQSDDALQLTDLSGVKHKLKNVYATIFDKDGKYRSQYQSGPCIFPYIYGNTKQLFFDCNKDKDEGQRCPVEVDKNRRALKWGFCPADPKETRKQHNLTDVYAKATNIKGKIDKGFKSGKCIFPFRYHPSYDLSWDCVSTKHGHGQKWCATSLKNGRDVVHELPIAADREDRIYQKKWDWASLYNKKGEFNDDFLRYHTRGYCPAEKVVKTNDKYDITLDNFNINKCNQTDSKGGYSKNLLKKFAVRELNIPLDKLEGQKKNIICALIAEKITEMRTKSGLIGQSPVKVYTKDPKLCEKGESGGGYYLGHLRKMASKYFGMDPTYAKTASKTELCQFIIPIVESEKAKIESKTPATTVKLSSVYQKNPYYCEEGPRKGGYTLKELKEIATTYFGVGENVNKKEEICQIIRDALEKEKIIDDSKNTNKYHSTMSDDPDMSFSNLKSLKSFDGKTSAKKTKKKNNIHDLLKKKSKKSKK
jgi:hypothetical protein